MDPSNLHAEGGDTLHGAEVDAVDKKLVTTAGTVRLLVGEAARKQDGPAASGLLVVVVVISASIKLIGKNTLRLRVGGSLDVTTVLDLETTLSAILKRQPWHVHLDLSRLRMIDSIGVGALIRFYKRLHALGCWVTVSGLRDQPLLVFRLLRLDRTPGALGLDRLPS